jgi:hypothetical protein
MSLKKPLVMDDAGYVRNIGAGETLDAPVANPEVISRTNGEATSVVIGTPVYADSDGSIKKARANALGTSRVVGLVDDTSIANGASGNIQTDQVLTATITEWDAVVTGGSGGLVANTAYFLDAANAGKLTATAPTTAGNYVVQVGIALSATELLVKIQPPIGL